LALRSSPISAVLLAHLHLDREVYPGDTETAHRGGRHAVGEYAVGIAAHVRNRIRPRHVGDTFNDAVAGQPRVGSGIEIGGDLPRDDAAVAHHAILDDVPLGPAW